MWSRADGEGAFASRLLPAENPDRLDRIQAWTEWQLRYGNEKLRKFIRMRNYSTETDEDIFQETMVTAFQEVERGRYRPRQGVPFSAYVKGIARNKIREARRKGRRLPCINLDKVAFLLADSPSQEPEIAFEIARKQSQLHNGLEMLPDSRRQVLKRFIRGEGTAEIARAMEISQDLVRQHKSRGLKMLRKIALAASEPGARSR